MRHRGEDAAPDLLVGQRREDRSTKFAHALAGVKYRKMRFLRSDQSSTTLSCLWVAYVVVEHDVYLLVRGYCLVDLAQEPSHLLAVLAAGSADHLATGYLERGEQRGCAVALVCPDVPYRFAIALLLCGGHPLRQNVPGVVRSSVCSGSRLGRHSRTKLRALRKAPLSDKRCAPAT